MTGFPLKRTIRSRIDHHFFKEHVKNLQQLNTACFKIHEMDQITMTIMKLNLLQGDFAGCFDESQGVASQILPYCIDTMEEHMSTMAQCFKESFPNTTALRKPCKTLTILTPEWSHIKQYSEVYSCHCSCGLKFIIPILRTSFLYERY